MKRDFNADNTKMKEQSRNSQDFFFQLLLLHPLSKNFAKGSKFEDKNIEVYFWIS